MKLSLSEQLKDKGIRPSWQRIAILDFLLSNRIHPSADQVYTMLSSSMPTLSKATVYNTLNLFADKGVVKTMSPSGVERHYDGVVSRHGHIICPICSRIDDVDYIQDDIDALDRMMERIDADSVDFVINRICDKCRHESI